MLFLVVNLFFSLMPSVAAVPSALNFNTMRYTQFHPWILFKLIIIIHYDDNNYDYVDENFQKLTNKKYKSFNKQWAKNR